MTANLFDDDPVRDAEIAAALWASQNGYAPITEDQAAQWLEPTTRRSYVGRHCAYEDGTRVLYGICADPDLCDRLESGAAQEHRPPAQVPPGHCGWCGGAR